MMSSTTKMPQWTYNYFTIPLLVVIIAVATTSAAPSGPPEDNMIGPVRGGYYSRSREPISNTDDNVIPINLDGGQRQIPVLYDPQIIQQQQPSENAILNFLLARRLVLGNNRLRSFTDSNDNSRKRSYSKYCSFNAVSCFGRRRR